MEGRTVGDMSLHTYVLYAYGSMLRGYMYAGSIVHFSMN